MTNPRVPAATTGTNILARLIVPGLTVIPAHTNFSAFSPTYYMASAWWRCYWCLS
jgi:hypothetical protein